MFGLQVLCKYVRCNEISVLTDSCKRYYFYKVSLFCGHRWLHWFLSVVHHQLWMWKGESVWVLFLSRLFIDIAQLLTLKHWICW